MKRPTFEEYLSAVDIDDPQIIKYVILLSAIRDPDIDFEQFKKLMNRAYPEV